jgi:hypothetical protein
MFYLYERLNPDGSVNAVIDSEGTEIYLETPMDLWSVVKQILDEDKKRK